MCVFRVWRVLCVLCYVGASLCMNRVEYEMNYADNYDNEISQDQQEGGSPATPCQAADLSRWDKLFIALEDSHMRQNMLLEALEQCCGGMASVRAQVERLAQGTCKQCMPSLQSACRGQMEQVGLVMQRSLVELRDEATEREARLNSTLHQLLQGGHEQNAMLKRLEESSRAEASGGGQPVGSEHSGIGPTTQKPGGSGPGLGLGVKPFPSSGLKEQDVTSPLDMAKMERALVAIATELQKVNGQLNRLMERVG
ncbi:pentraxin-related protein PTX3-like [Myripristis murdjan]|uniref:pentraxin-related protein PTX3-like n=1 Tax=Myripristis murdjan TaxID=586833 RepID=UPI001175E7B4|nr:pentraxin-related protein PTX3-like [Myripristis murdjan]